MIMGVIGCGGQGTGLATSFASRQNVQLAYVCDPDPQRAERAAEEVTQSAGKKPTVVTDLRHILDDKSVDAVTVATPDHWHAPAAILACQAGKHVYVEKPCSHNIREGRLLVEAARRYDRVVQHGTQARSNHLIADAVQMLRDRVIGTVLAAKAWNIQRRGSIGRAAPSDPPPGVDYDMWVGPAPFVPYQSNRFHYDWHWWYNFGTGDTGNDGVHEIDYARWGLGVQTHPSRVVAVGGKLFHDDDQQFPDTQTAVFHYPGDGTVGSQRQLIFEMRLWSTNYPYNIDNGCEFYGTEGKLLVSKRGKLQIWGSDNQSIQASPKEPSELLDHHDDFLDAIVTRRRPHADIEIGHLSATLCHLANIATRVGGSLDFDPATEQILHDEKANQLVGRTYRDHHWAVPKDS
jgi:predicted dehydrogenase